MYILCVHVVSMFDLIWPDLDWHSWDCLSSSWTCMRLACMFCCGTAVLCLVYCVCLFPFSTSGLYLTFQTQTFPTFQTKHIQLDLSCIINSTLHWNWNTCTHSILYFRLLGIFQADLFRTSNQLMARHPGVRQFVTTDTVWANLKPSQQIGPCS